MTRREVEVTPVFRLGLCLLLEGEKLFVPFAEFPWFGKATIEQLSTILRPSKNHLYWPQLDVDLSLESIRNPEAFPLLSTSRD